MTTQLNTNDARTTWDTYTSAWGVTSVEEKLALFEQSVSAECNYRDPLAVTSGWQALAGYMMEFHNMVLGGHFNTREFKYHNNRSVAEWDMCAGDGSVVAAGISYGEYDENGKVVNMAGFFDLPQG